MLPSFDVLPDDPIYVRVIDKSSLLYGRKGLLESLNSSINNSTVRVCFPREKVDAILFSDQVEKW